jgi:ABC-2 type transport system permease protein
MSGHCNFSWSVRREFWEHYRSLILVPAAVAIVVFASVLVGMLRHHWNLGALEPAKRAVAIAMPYSIAASVILLTSFMVAFFYSLDSLHAERRDRSVLFWKSMPVSDATTVLAKAFIAFAVMPAIGFAAALVTQLLVLAAATALVPGLGDVALGQMTVVMMYGLAIHALWFVPIYGYLMLVSAWAPRAPFLWAIIPPIALVAAEKLALDTGFVASVLRYRFMGAMTEGFTPGAMRGPITQISQLEPARFFASPNLWIGLAIGAACICGAIRLRRQRDPS